ncbi:MAG: single-stranded-DNA-specific exonuclease RecJ [Acidobacteriaceae bacterium]|nr:single-stranded-DNA-specific exonuclease RecJ [Acidobacteriaceae bacterium]
MTSSVGGAEAAQAGPAASGSRAASAGRLARPETRWILPGRGGGGAADRLARELALEALPARVLAKRGFADPDSARAFLYPGLEALHDPMSMRDMDVAVERLAGAIAKGEPILLYGDYDADGTSSIVILKKAIEILGGRADFHIPHRLNEGYGMRSEIVERAAANGARLIVSVDTGIRANEAVRRANALGVDVIVTDHHLPEAELPPALAVLNPNRRDCGYPEKSLCGAGVTLKLVQALLARSGLSRERQIALLDSFLKPVAIATVADIVPLTGENRVFVQRGLSGLRRVRNHGLRALMAVAGFEDGECPSAHQVAFRLAPRINAAGRMATARDVIELFLTEDAERASVLAAGLDALNRERQRVETEVVEAILKQCEEERVEGELPALVFSGSGWHLGVLGIVASRLVERFARPVFVLSDAMADGEDGPCLAGSGRSIPAFHLLEALESMPEVFTRFGGHRQAAGVTLRCDRLESFRSRFAEVAGRALTEEDLRPRYEVDAEASFTELTERCVKQVLALGPFGFGNPAPLFLAREAEVAGPSKASADGKHLTVALRHEGRLLFSKAWGFGDRAELFAVGAKVDVLFQIEDDPFSRKRGYGSWCVTVKDAKAAGSGG